MAEQETVFDLEDEDPEEVLTLVDDEPDPDEDQAIEDDLAAPSNEPQKTLESRLETAVADMDRWADAWGLAADPYVMGLGHAVRTRSNLTAWASRDPVEALPVPDVANSAPLRKATGLERVAAALTTLRGILVFVPVALTWWAIHEATRAFEGVRAANPGVEVTFFDVWASGAGDPATTWALPNIAMVDAGAIAAIVVISAVCGPLRAAGARRRRRAESRADSQRMQVALGLAAPLHACRDADAESLPQAIAAAVSDLTSASREVAETAAALEVAATGVASLSTRLAELEAAVEGLTGEVGANLTAPMEAVTISVSQLQASLDRLTAWVGSDPTRIVEGFTDTVEAVTTGIERTGTSLEFGTMQLREDLEALSVLLAEMTKANGR